jgi:hypothetical protein
MHLIFVQTPCLGSLREYQVVIVQILYFQTDIRERLEFERVLHNTSVLSQTVDRGTLDKQTVTLVLELTKYLTFMDIAEQNHRAREAYILHVRPTHTPLSQKVTCFPAFLTRER